MTSSLLPKEVFLSHSSSDHEFATALAGVLAQHGVPTWYSRRDIRGAQEWHDEIGRALARCDWFLVLLSPESVQSHWVKMELVYALDRAAYQQRIIPCTMRPCNAVELSWTLSGFQAIDFSTRTDQGLRDLLRVWGLGYAGNSPWTGAQDASS